MHRLVTGAAAGDQRHEPRAGKVGTGYVTRIGRRAKRPAGSHDQPCDGVVNQPIRICDDMAGTRDAAGGRRLCRRPTTELNLTGISDSLDEVGDRLRTRIDGPCTASRDVTGPAASRRQVGGALSAGASGGHGIVTDFEGVRYGEQGIQQGAVAELCSTQLGDSVGRSPYGRGGAEVDRFGSAEQADAPDRTGGAAHSGNRVGGSEQKIAGTVLRDRI